MANLDPANTLKRLRSNYRLVLINEDNYEEVAKLKITRMSVYIVLSTLFVLMIAITTSLIIFTPLKYYLPGLGYGTAKSAREYRQLKIRTDSMEKALMYQQKYVEDLQKVLQGEISTRDTNLLTLPSVENSND